MSAEQNIAIIKRAVEALNTKNLAMGASLIHPEFMRHDLAGALPEAGARGIADVFRLLVRAVPDARVEIKQIFATEDRVAVHQVLTGTHQGELLGVPATGKHIEVNWVNLYRIFEGKIAETWQLLDVWGLMRQVGKV